MNLMHPDHRIIGSSNHRILGVDPGLVRTGWGVISSCDNHLKFIACGTISPPATDALAARLHHLHDALQKIITQHKPAEAAIEQTFVSVNGASTLKLGQARGALTLSLSLAGLVPAEYAATLVKKSVVGAGRAEKSQIQMMVKTLLPGSNAKGADAADALAIAICHAHHRQLHSRLNTAW